MMIKRPPEFNNQMTRSQTILGFIYLPIHIFVLPLVLSWIFPDWDTGKLNLVYFGISTVLVLLVFLSYLKANYYNFVDHIGWCIVTLFMALGLDYLLSLGVSFLALLLPQLSGESPNDQTIMELAAQSSSVVKAVSIFLAPIVEEVLFRGVIFGSLRSRSRVWAYVLSALIFSLLHVWQYALAGMDWTILLYTLQYIPVSIALAFCYERSRSIWCPIAFHMFINAMSFKLMELLESMDGVL